MYLKVSKSVMFNFKITSFTKAQFHALIFRWPFVKKHHFYPNPQFVRGGKVSQVEQSESALNRAELCPVLRWVTESAPIPTNFILWQGWEFALCFLIESIVFWEQKSKIAICQERTERFALWHKKVKGSEILSKTWWKLQFFLSDSLVFESKKQ